MYILSKLDAKISEVRKEEAGGVDRSGETNEVIKIGAANGRTKYRQRIEQIEIRLEDFFRKIVTS